MTEFGKKDNKTWDTMMTVPGSEFIYEIGRDHQAVARDGMDRGFSVEAMDTLIKHMITFIGTRINRHHSAHDVMPQQMTVRIKVTLDSQPRAFDDSENESE